MAQFLLDVAANALAGVIVARYAAFAARNEFARVGTAILTRA